MNHNANVVDTADREQKNKEKETTLQLRQVSMSVWMGRARPRHFLYNITIDPELPSHHQAEKNETKTLIMSKMLEIRITPKL